MRVSLKMISGSLKLFSKFLGSLDRCRSVTVLAPHVSLQNDLRSPKIAFLLLCFRLSSRRMAGSSCFSSAKEQSCSAYQSHASAFKLFFGSCESFAARHANSRILLPSLACGMKKKEISEKPQEHGTHGDQSMLAGLCRCRQQIAELPESSGKPEKRPPHPRKPTGVQITQS